MTLTRRQLLKKVLNHGPILALGGSLLETTAVAAPPQWQLGPLREENALGLRLPEGVKARVIATSGEPVPTVSPSSHEWHKSPDGGACFATQAGGWIYVSNCEEFFFRGGAGAIEFAKDGTIERAYPILKHTQGNCAGGATPWGTWLSCEEVDGGYVYETDPTGHQPAKKRPALGRFRHEAVAVDDIHGHLYLTEDEKDGCLYRFTPDQPLPYLDSGRLEVACVDPVTGVVGWTPINDPIPNPLLFQTRTRYQETSACQFAGGEGIWFQSGMVYFTTKRDNRVWVLDTQTNQLAVLYDAQEKSSPVLSGVDNLCSAPDGRLLVAEDGGDMQLVLLDHKGNAQPLVQVMGQKGSEITGPAFSPDGRRLYFSSQRGKDADRRLGITYELFLSV